MSIDKADIGNNGNISGWEETLRSGNIRFMANSSNFSWRDSDEQVKEVNGIVLFGHFI